MENIPGFLSRLVEPVTLAQDGAPTLGPGLPTGEPAVDAIVVLGLGFAVVIVTLVVGHSYWAYQKARRRPLQDSEDAVRNLDSGSTPK